MINGIVFERLNNCYYDRIDVFDSNEDDVYSVVLENEEISQPEYYPADVYAELLEKMKGNEAYCIDENIFHLKPIVLRVYLNC